MVCLRSVWQVKCSEFDEIWLIVRSVGKAANMLGHKNVRHMPELSPTKGLFYAYLDWKKAGDWDRACFEKKYVPRFLREAKTNPKFINNMLELQKLDKEGKKIALVCFCGDETLCHRSIIGALCMANGISVEKPDAVKKYAETYFLPPSGNNGKKPSVHCHSADNALPAKAS